VTALRASPSVLPSPGLTSVARSDSDPLAYGGVCGTTLLMIINKVSGTVSLPGWPPSPAVTPIR